MRIVATSGQQAPGAPPGSIFTGFVNPVINDVGQTAFVAGVMDLDTPEPRTGIWSQGGGNLRVVALENSQPPGFQARPWPDLPDFAFNTRGETLFRGPGGIWREANNSLELAVPTGVPVMVDGKSETFQSVSRPVVSRHGVVAFLAQTGRYAGGVHVLTNGHLSLIADPQVPTPGVAIGPTGFVDRPPAMNESGKVAFWGFGASDGSIWTNVSGSLELVAQATAPHRYNGDGIVFQGLSVPALTAAGEVAFFGRLFGDGITEQNDDGLWKLDESGLNPFVREAEQAPDFPAGVVFSTFPPARERRVVSDDAGNLVFLAGMRGTGIHAGNESSVWRLRNDELELIAQAGSETPGVEIGASFFRFDPPMVNKLGQIAFSATLAGPGIYSTNDVGIWARDRQGNLQLIVREGDFVDLDPGVAADLRTITYVSLLGIDEGHGDEGQRYAFNNRGQIAFQVQLSDGRHAILVSNHLLVPEPLTLSLLALGVLLSSHRRCQR